MKQYLFKSIVILLLFSPLPLFGSQNKSGKETGIVLAMFGTSVEPALNSLLNIHSAVKKAYPDSQVRMAFTSNIIRAIWQERRADQAYRKLHTDIPDEIFSIQGPLAAIATLQDQGVKSIIVQSTHIAPAEEYLDLVAYVNGMAAIKTIKRKNLPFQTIVCGRPALGTFGTQHSYADDIRIAAKALTSDAAMARQEGAALVYMGHGNDHFPSGGVYMEFAARMREMYPDVFTTIGTVEGFPGLDDVVAGLKDKGIKKIILKPFMVVAGDHALNDMAGPEDDSWLSSLTREGFEVQTVKKGLGETDSFVNIFVRHLAETAEDYGLKL